MKRELSYREEMVQQLQIVRGNAYFALLKRKKRISLKKKKKSNTCIFQIDWFLKQKLGCRESKTFNVCDPPQMIYSFFFLFYVDTLCNELDQERKARYAIQQKLKGNLEIKAAVGLSSIKVEWKRFFSHCSRELQKKYASATF